MDSEWSTGSRCRLDHQPGSALCAGAEVTRYLNLTHAWLAQVMLDTVYASAGWAGLVLVRVV